MKKISLLFLFPFVLFGQKEIPLKSAIKKATVFLTGAQVEHSGSIELKPGKQDVVMLKLTDFLDPNSVQLKAKGDLTILSVRTRKNFEDLKMSNTELEELNNKKDALSKKERELQDEHDILSYDKDLLLKNRDLKGQEQGLKTAELKEAYTFMHQKISEITLRLTVIQDEFKKITSEKNKIQQEIDAIRSKPVINYSEIIIETDVHSNTTAEFYFSYITPNAAWKPYYDLRSDGIGKPIQLETKALVNQTTGIEWKDIQLVLSTNDPYDNAREAELEPWYIQYYNYPESRSDSGPATTSYDYSGQKIQGEVIDFETGEPLPFTKITFPNNPNSGTLTDVDGKFSVIVPRGETNITASYIGYTINNQNIRSPYIKFILKPEAKELEEVQILDLDAQQLSGMDNMSYSTIELKKNKGRKKVSEGYYSGSVSDSFGTYTFNTTANVSSIQKDLRVEYAIQSLFSIPSDGADHRVQIVNYEMPATYEYHTAPKIEASVFLTAKISGWEKLNLLSGDANLYFDGTFIGKTFLDVNQTKDTLTFSLGKDNKIQIERTKIAEKSSKKTIGNRQKVEYTWQITVRNNGGAAIPIIIKDQFPVSIDSDIKVKTGDYPEAQLDDKTGILTWKLILNTSQSKTLQFNYLVDYDKNKVLYLE